MKESWLLLQDGRKTYLLARDHQNYYLILADKFLTWETEEWLIEHGISRERLEELPLNYKTLPRKQLRGIALTGTSAGDALYLYPKSEKRQRYTFSDDCSEEQIDTFFEGVERFLAPSAQKKKSSVTGDWRTERQDPEVYRKMEYVCIGVTVLSMLFAFGYIQNQGVFWYTALLLTNGAAIALTIIFPQYFTLLPDEKNKKKSAWNMSWSLCSQLIVSMVYPMRNWLDEGVFWISVFVCGSVATAVMGLLSEEFRRAKVWLLAVFFFVGVLGQEVVGHINEVYDFSEPESYVLTVENLERSSGRRSTRYECTVTLPDGRSVDLDISKNYFYNLAVGGPVRVEVGTGALGIEYGNAYPVD